MLLSFSLIFIVSLFAELSLLYSTNCSLEYLETKNFWHLNLELAYVVKNIRNFYRKKYQRKKLYLKSKETLDEDNELQKLIDDEKNNEYDMNIKTRENSPKNKLNKN